MTATEPVSAMPASIEELQKTCHELNLRVAELEAAKSALEQENKALRTLLERVIDHRQKSHSELVLLLTSLVSKLPINDVGTILTKLVEHHTNVSQFHASLVKGATEGVLDQPSLLRTLDQTKRDLTSAIKPLIEELIGLDVPLEPAMLRALGEQPDLMFSPPVVRATRCFIKGQVPRERIVREFGEPALIFFNDLTTDPKRNSRPKPDEIVLGFKNDFEALFQQHPEVAPEKRQELRTLYDRVQRSRTPGEACSAQRGVFQRLSFLIDLLHFYEHQNTEPADVLFAQRLPVLIEQLVLTGPPESRDEKMLCQAESLLQFVVNPDHRQMIINNLGKSGGAARTLRFVLRLRSDQVLDQDHVVAEFVKHLITAAPQTPPTPQRLASILRLLAPERQAVVARAIMRSDRLRKDEAERLGRAVGTELGLTGLEEQLKVQETVPPEVERRLAWNKIKDLISRRADAPSIARAILERLHAKYDTEEIRQSWITLTEADPISLIRIFCQLPYRPDGKTDPIARTVMETYVSRLTHEKYATTYSRVANSLRNMFHAKPDSPTLLNFLALIRWVSPESADKMCHDIGMPVPASA